MYRFPSITHYIRYQLKRMIAQILEARTHAFISVLERNGVPYDEPD